MKTTIIILLSAIGIAFAGPEPFSKPMPPPPVQPTAAAPGDYFRAGEWDIGVAGQGVWTQTASKQDRYLGLDHAFGGTLDGEYFFSKYFGGGISFSGLSVDNSNSLETGFLGGQLPAAIPATGTSGFIGNVLVRAVARYPIGQFAPYIFAGGGAIFNGGNSTLVAPNGLTGKQLKFQAIEHDVKALIEPGAGIEFRLTPNIGIFAEGSFDKIDRPQSNYFGARVGMRIALP